MSTTEAVTVKFTREELRKLDGFLYGPDFSDQPTFQSAINKIHDATRKAAGK
jgi:hypothetical protein